MENVSIQDVYKVIHEMQSEMSDIRVRVKVMRLENKDLKRKISDIEKNFKSYIQKRRRKKHNNMSLR